MMTKTLMMVVLLIMMIVIQCIMIITQNLLCALPVVLGTHRYVSFLIYPVVWLTVGAPL